MIWVAILLLLMILIVGLSLDSARGFLVAHQLQNAADAAALAGACFVKLDPNGARDIAIDVALLNFADGNAVQLADNPANLADGDVVVGRYDRGTHEFTPTYEGVNALKVVARRTETSLGGKVPLNFGPIAGIDDVDIWRHVIAMTSGGTGAGLIALRPDGVGLLLNGGAVQVNSADDDATRLIGTVQLNADELNIWGDISATGGDVTFQPGVYILDGNSKGLKSGLVVAGNANLCAKGVMFYITGDGVVDLAGTGDIRVTPPNINDSEFCHPGFAYPDDFDYEFMNYEGPPPPRRGF